MGSEKYPNENEFDMFLNSHGGSMNASTGNEAVGNKIINKNQ